MRVFGKRVKAYLKKATKTLDHLSLFFVVLKYTFRVVVVEKMLNEEKKIRQFKRHIRLAKLKSK